jgi:hypothetical protein
MSHNFKPGDLALIINCGDKSLIGKAVEVLELLIDSKKEYDAYGCLHTGAADGSLSAFIDLGGGDVWLFSQKNLMPLRGDFAPEQQKSREVVA